MKALIREEIVKIPTYKTAEAEKSPLFIEKRAYQGSTGKVYPLPVTEKIYDEKELKEYKALILENDFIYVMILPELGGRIQCAYDKTNGYDFVYYNHVIKPALVGLAGPWISGGIEFNWPQHHRPSTFSPVDYSISENADGSVTAYVGETDVMYGTKGMAAITVYPDKAYIEIKGTFYNPTDYPQTFLWWANPAVAGDNNTFSVFPPDVNAVYDHGKRDVSTFPIATGEYYKYDYSAGVDISRYKNIKVPTSYMAAHSDFDFIGNFDESVDNKSKEYDYQPSDLYYKECIQKIEQKKTNSQKSSGGCYVATCVYGSYDCPEVWTLRRFRDDILSKNFFGRLFIKCYYAVSPTAVKLFGGYMWFHKLFKLSLDKLVAELQDKGVENTSYSDK